MYPSCTSYLLATTPADYKACHALQRNLGLTDSLAFPTIFARREKKVIGFLTTSVRTGAVCAGPLMVAPQLSRTIFVAIRLMDAYEMILKHAGVTRYLFGISKEHVNWQVVVTRLGFVPYNETATSWWFTKDL